MPTPRKDPADRTGHHAPATELAAPPKGRVVPRSPVGLPAPLKRAWEAIWKSPVAALLDPDSDLPVMARLFRLYRLAERVDRQIELADPDRLVLLLEDPDPTEETRRMIAEISAAIDKWNTTIGTQVKIATEIRQIEQTLGISPKARLGLGVALASQSKSALESLMDD